jgi:hypothetical protein
MRHIRASLPWTPLVAMSLMVVCGQATAQSQRCSWKGTSPFCSGECGSGESEQTRADSDPGLVDNASGARINFGASCLTGTKALCCTTPGTTCRWKGTAPFCAGRCGGGETQQTPPDGSNSGSSCWTGSKVYCCTLPSVGATSSPLTSTCPLKQAVCGGNCCDQTAPCCGDHCCSLLPPVGTPTAAPPPASCSPDRAPCGFKDATGVIRTCCPPGLQCCSFSAEFGPECKTTCLH